ncbi:hypothetical protein [Cognaticolwellia beringensis]|uniref:Uncharacterized protein n=1 Tax=Cognaticolwellia beringensis TaxID=1967665 RepID=A0A222GB69_9GAMM|nr:hypothetical protein [Cognaticolwellia beringensis]ASP49146.1 hypothetical protein B5D82_16070 [Cognaticolwellia beringensis]
MDIFTTALTRVVPVPIKPTNLKVKALAKAAATHAVSDDIAGLEDPALYFKKPSDEKSPSKEETHDNDAAESVEPSTVPADNTGKHIDIYDDSENAPVEKDDKPHLDIFV